MGAMHAQHHTHAHNTRTHQYSRLMAADSSAGLATANSLTTDITVHGLLSVSGRQYTHLMVNHILGWGRVKGRCGYVCKHWAMISDYLDFLYQETSKGKKGPDWVRFTLILLSNIMTSLKLFHGLCWSVPFYLRIPQSEHPRPKPFLPVTVEKG